MKGKNLFVIGLFLVIPFSITLATCIANQRKGTDQAVNERIKNAVDSDDVAKAFAEIRSVAMYAEKEGLNTGDMREWYAKLKKVEARLEAASKLCTAEKADDTLTAKLQKENALLYLQANLMKGDKANVPEGISLHPYYTHYCVLFVFFSIIGFFGLFSILFGIASWDDYL